MAEFNQFTTPDVHPQLLATLAERKMAKLEDELETQLAVTGQVFEYLPLHGGVSLRREVTDDTTPSPITINYHVTTLSGTCTWGESAVTTPEGKVVYAHTDYGHEAGEPLSGFRRAILTFKLLKARPDHWDRETDFYGEFEED